MREKSEGRRHERVTESVGAEKRESEEKKGIREKSEALEFRFRKHDGL